MGVFPDFTLGSPLQAFDLLSLVSDGALLVDEQNRCLRANRALLEIVGADNMADVQRCYDVLQDLHDKEYARWVGPKGRSAAKRDVPFCFSNLRGDTKHTLVTLWRVRSEHTQESYVLFGFRDVSELERLQKGRSTLMRVLAHELRNPLQTMKALVQILRLRMRDVPDATNHLDRLKQQTDLISNLFEGILSAYETDNQCLELFFLPVDLVSLVRRVISKFRHKPSVKISLSVDEPSIPVSVDPPRIGALIHNLLHNALEHSRRSGHVEVRLWVEANSACLSLKDDGKGIAPEDLQRLFDGFYRPDNFAQWSSGGIGLGLFSGRNIARRHGGDLTAQSALGLGTTFTLTLPLHRQLPLPHLALWAS